MRILIVYRKRYSRHKLLEYRDGQMKRARRHATATTRLTLAEQAIVKAAAAQEGVVLSDFVRAAILESARKVLGSTLRVGADLDGAHP